MIDKKNKIYWFLGVLVFFVLLIGGFYAYSVYQEQKNQEMTSMYINWLESAQGESKDPNAMLLLSKQFRELISNNLKYSIDFYIADLYAQLEKKEKVAEQLKLLAQNTNAPKFFSSLAKIKLANYFLQWNDLEIAKDQLSQVDVSDQKELSFIYDWVYANLYEQQGEKQKAKLLYEKMITLAQKMQNIPEKFLFTLELKKSANQ